MWITGGCKFIPYLSRDHESAEEIPQRVEWSSNNRRNQMVWSDRRRHHAVEGEVEEGEVGNEEEPEEFGSCPLEAHHGVYDEGVVSCLDKHIGDLHDNL